MASEPQLICPVCHDRIGVYEPIVVVGEDTRRTTSLAKEPELRHAGRELVHLACSRVRS
jgi:hypothetical protein